MASASIDASEIRKLSADITKAGAGISGEVRPVLQKGALNIKTKMRADLAASPHFKGIERSVTYDTIESASGISADIGPDKAVAGGALANIAYWGGSRGGGSVPDPQSALDAEAPKFEAALLKILGDIL